MSPDETPPGIVYIRRNIYLSLSKNEYTYSVQSTTMKANQSDSLFGGGFCEERLSRPGLSSLGFRRMRSKPFETCYVFKG